MQVLEALASPSSPAAAEHLRAGAQHLVEGGDVARWLDAGLLPKLLAILRALPSPGRSPRQAAEVCAAAAAVISNLLDRLEGLRQRSEVQDAVLADDEACCALVRWGMTTVEAAQELPPGQGRHLPAHAHAIARRPGQLQSQGNSFWTPLTMCMYAVVLLHRRGGCEADAGDLDSTSGSDAPEGDGAYLEQAVAAPVLQRVLQLAIDTPGSEAPACSHHAHFLPLMPVAGSLISPRCSCMFSSLRPC
jgi:hypothetical protein